ncbi:MAG: hypothetical protein HC780_18790 [Leptolyngbyaceae cyanobacterium CSU_1_3]|nr:hypothetical protein [Leptolyngbyaceae cyanobacterium CSU_1_3]
MRQRKFCLLSGIVGAIAAIGMQPAEPVLAQTNLQTVSLKISGASGFSDIQMRCELLRVGYFDGRNDSDAIALLSLPLSPKLTFLKHPLTPLKPQESV